MVYYCRSMHTQALHTTVKINLKHQYASFTVCNCVKQPYKKCATSKKAIVKEDVKSKVAAK